MDLCHLLGSVHLGSATSEIVLNLAMDLTHVPLQRTVALNLGKEQKIYDIFIGWFIEKIFVVLNSMFNASF